MKKRNTIIVICVLVVMAAAIAVLAYLNAPKGEIESGTITVIRGEETLAAYSMDEIKTMPYVEAYKYIDSSSQEDSEGTFRGIPLRTLLGEVGDDVSKIAIISEDGFKMAFSVEEIFNSDNILLAYSIDGESLGKLGDKNGTGPFRLIIVDDEFGNRCAKYVYKIELIG